MKHHMFALLLALLMIVTVMAGCKKPDQPDNPDTPDDPSDPSNPSDPDDPNQPTDPPDPHNWIEAQDQITDGLTLHGRVPVVDGKLKLFFTNSGFSLCFKGTGVRAKLQATTPKEARFLGYLNVYIDGKVAPANTLCIDKDGSYTLINGLEDGVHTLEVRKRNEASYGSSSTITVSEISPIGNGMIDANPPAARAHTIEFIGDSITCGFGNMWLTGNNSTFSTEVQDGTMTYATLAARALGAEAQIVARSGMAFLKGSDKTSWMDYYEKTAMLDYAAAVASSDPWDFDAHPVDVVVINLGTNDKGAKFNGANVTAQQMTEHAYNFLSLVRRCNPNAQILWVYGMMGTTQSDAIAQGVRNFAQQNGDDMVTYFELAPMVNTEEGVGVAGHPTIQTNINRSIVLAEKIAELTGWECDFTPVAEAQAYFTRNYYLTQTDVYAASSIEQTNQKIDALLGSVTSENAKDTTAQIYTLQKSLYKPTDVSDRYIVVSTCDDTKGWTFGGRGGADTALTPAGTKALYSTSPNNPHILNVNNKLNISMPSDWSKWYLEMWIYIDKPELLSKQKTSCIELSQEVDKIEFSYVVSSLNLQAGWNHIVLPLNTANTIHPIQFTTLNNIRVFLFTDGEVTLKISDIVLSRGKQAADRTALDAFDLTDTSNPAVAFAKTAATQREVDLAVQWLER